MATCSKPPPTATASSSCATASVNSRKYRVRSKLAAHTTSHTQVAWYTAWRNASPPAESQLWPQPPPPPPPLLLLSPPLPPYRLLQLSSDQSPKSLKSPSSSPPLLVPLLRRRVLLLLAHTCRQQCRSNEGNSVSKFADVLPGMCAVSEATLEELTAQYAAYHGDSYSEPSTPLK
jgi:hypothetical protein